MLHYLAYRSQCLTTSRAHTRLRQDARQHARTPEHGSPVPFSLQLAYKFRFRGKRQHVAHVGTHARTHTTPRTRMVAHTRMLQLEHECTHKHTLITRIFIENHFHPPLIVTICLLKRATSSHVDLASAFRATHEARDRQHHDQQRCTACCCRRRMFAC